VVIKQLGGNVNVRADDRSTALHWAASKGHIDCVEKLVQIGVDIMAVGPMFSQRSLNVP
jgi:ankyrin repeat protein